MLKLVFHILFYLISLFVALAALGSLEEGRLLLSAVILVFAQTCALQTQVSDGFLATQAKLNAYTMVILDSLKFPQMEEMKEAQADFEELQLSQRRLMWLGQIFTGLLWVIGFFGFVTSIY